MCRARAIAVAGLLLAGCAATEPPTIAIVPGVAAPAAAEAPLPPREESVVEAFGPLRIGQNFAEARAAFGPETVIETYAEESAGLKGSGYDVASNVFLLLGFDEVHVWDTPPEGIGVPFWKVYVKDGRVVGFVITAYGNESDPTTAKTRIGSCFLLGDESTIARSLGVDRVVVRDPMHQHTTYRYPERGVSVIAKEGKVRVFQVFGRLSPEKRDRLRSMVPREAEPRK